MSFDGLFTHAMIQEIKPLIGGRISKIHHPSQYEIILRIRVNRQNYDLLLSAHPEFARFHITEKKFDNPKQAPQFLMVLRKYIDRAQIKDIFQVDNDRIMIIEFERRDELGDLKSIYLVHEIMGRHSNIILTDKKTIYGAVKLLSPSVNSYRTILPGHDYVSAPAQDKLNPFISSFDFSSIDDENHIVMHKNIQQVYQGFSRQSADELVYQLNSHSSDNKELIFEQFIKKFDLPFHPTIVLSPSHKNFMVFPYETLNGEQKSYPTLSEMLDDFYTTIAKRYTIRQKASDLEQIIENALEKNQRKLLKLHDEYNDTDSANDYRMMGEILTSYMHQVKPGMSEITLPNFYENNQPLIIQLDLKYSPAQNAQNYFSKYNKLKKRHEHLSREIPKTEQEIYYLDHLLTQLNYAESEDLEVIRSELIREGYLKKKKHQATKQKKSVPESFYSSDGTLIMVGKNNQQNDELTMRTARKTDWWLHTKDIPGSHVVIRNNQPSEETFEEAAMLAAHFSKYAQSSSVPVDTTQIKYVHKPNGAKPGYVIYENQRTLFVTPSQHMIDEMRKRNHPKK